MEHPSILRILYLPTADTSLPCRLSSVGKYGVKFTLVGSSTEQELEERENRETQAQDRRVSGKSKNRERKARFQQKKGEEQALDDT